MTLEDGQYDAYLLDCEWGETGDGRITLTIDAAITSGARKGEVATFVVPATNSDGDVTEDLRAVMSHFSLDAPPRVPDDDVFVALVGLPCTLIAIDGKVGFSGTGTYDIP